jgi:micrococcal nuclease
MRSAPALVVVLLFLLATGLTADQAANRVGLRFDAQVVRVGDGDSVELIPVGETKPLTVRLEGIDAPELAEPFGREARAFARTLLLKQRVNVHGRDNDRYGRLVARVSVGNRDASLELLRAGLACYFTQYATDPVLAEALARARASGIGFWAANAQKPQCAALSPAAPRQRTREAPPLSRFRGNVNSRLYHTSTCPNANCRNCTRTFATEAEAQAAGFKPAGDCLRR